jgi:negative regulator of replication initiation
MKKLIQLKIEQELWSRLADLARSEGRSISNLLRRLIELAVKDGAK